MKTGLGLNTNSLSGCYLYLEMVSKSFFAQAQVPRDENDWKMPNSKLGHFWPYTLPLSPNWEKLDFWTPDKYSSKGANGINVF